jgi:hypothetical protein
MEILIGWNIIETVPILQLPAAGIPEAAGLGAGINFGSQFVGWGAMNAILVALGPKQRKAQPGATGASEISAEWLSCQTKNFERLVLLKAGLDKGCIAAGDWLATQPPKQGDKIKDRCGSFRSGVGLGIMAQGTFLLIGVIMRSLLVYERRNA